MATKSAEKRKEILAVLEIAEEVITASPWVTEQERAERLAWFASCRGLAAGAVAASLRTFENDVLTEWNEGVGPDVEAFWRRVSAAGLAVVRKRNVLAETLSRAAVKNMIEYVALEDSFEALQRGAVITQEQANALAEMLDAFANAPKNKRYFR